MPKEFPYQLVAFLDREPGVGEPVYGGSNGWYPQIALKRRFKIENLSEHELKEKIKTYCESTAPFVIEIGELTKPERMPVKVLEVKQTGALMSFHHDFIKMMGDNLISRYPERDGDNYYPHITAEYGGKGVIDTESYADKKIRITHVWLLKDTDNEDSGAYSKFSLSPTYLQ